MKQGIYDDNDAHNPEEERSLEGPDYKAKWADEPGESPEGIVMSRFTGTLPWQRLTIVNAKDPEKLGVPILTDSEGREWTLNPHQLPVLETLCGSGWAGIIADPAGHLIGTTLIVLAEGDRIMAIKCLGSDEPQKATSKSERGCDQFTRGFINSKIEPGKKYVGFVIEDRPNFGWPEMADRSLTIAVCGTRDAFEVTIREPKDMLPSYLGELVGVKVGDYAGEETESRLLTEIEVMTPRS